MLLPLFILFFMMLMVLYGPRSLWRTLAPHFFVSATTTVSLRRRAGWLGVLCWYLGVIIFVITLAMYKLSFSQGFLLFIFVIMPIVVLVGSACRVGDYPQTELEQNDIYKQVGILTIIQILTPILFLIFINIF